MVEFRKAIKKGTKLSEVETVQPAAAALDFSFSHTAPLRISADRVAQDLYLEGLALAAAVFEWASGRREGGFPLSGPLDALIGDICNFLAGEQAWKLLCLCRASSEPRYLLSHSLNVCITTAYMAANMNFSNDQVTALAKVAFLHDIGLAKIISTIDIPLRLTEEQFFTVRNHPMESLKIIDTAGCCEDPGMALAAVEHHERIDGSGYPNHKKAAEISSAAQIMMVADIFDAMTHKRKFREAVNPFAAVRTISSLAGRQIPTDIARSFLQIMSLYPIGSGVRLNNGIIARVIASNLKQLTKPTIQIVSASGEFFAPDQIVELQKEKLLFIREPVCLGPLDPVFNIG